MIILLLLFVAATAFGIASHYTERSSYYIECEQRQRTIHNFEWADDYKKQKEHAQNISLWCYSIFWICFLIVLTIVLFF